MERAVHIKNNFPEIWESIIRRFQKYCSPSSKEDCWLWTGAKNENGYGRLAVTRGINAIRATHVAWLMIEKDFPDGLVIRHKCDNPPCCNPHHLEIGTKAQNTKDMYERGRASPPPRHIGKKHPRAVSVTPEQVKYILLSKESDILLGKMFGVSYMTIHRIRKGNHWAVKND